VANQAVFAALADPTRRGILESLRREPLTVGQIAANQTVSRPAVSQHLKVLQEADLVTARPEGNRRFYLIKGEGLRELRDSLDSFWCDALTAYAAEIERRVNEKK
jgi:DNA-binding transcriptional ArsR family regulator